MSILDFLQPNSERWTRNEVVNARAFRIPRNPKRQAIFRVGELGLYIEPFSFSLKGYPEDNMRGYCEKTIGPVFITWRDGLWEDIKFAVTWRVIGALDFLLYFGWIGALLVFVESTFDLLILAWALIATLRLYRR